MLRFFDKILIAALLVFGGVFGMTYSINWFRLYLNNEDKMAMRRGAKLYYEMNCRTCHGDDGKQPIHDSYPKLNGQNRGYLVVQLQDIYSGVRANGMSAVMKDQLEGLSKDDIEAIALFLSKI